MLEKTDYLSPDAEDEAIFAMTVPPDHYLRRVLAVVDFERCRDELAGCYDPTHGRPAKEPVLVFKLTFLQFHYNLSDREVMEAARLNLAFRYFLGLSLKSAPPHPTLLTKFRERIGVERYQRIFDNLLAQARQHGLVKDRLRLKDATHVVANIAIPSTVRLVAQVREQLLEAVRPYAPGRVAEEEARAAAIRTATHDLSGPERLLQRVSHLRAIVNWVELLCADLGPPPPGDAQRRALQEALGLAHKVLADRETPQAPDQLVSRHDPDARFGRHGGSYAGYLLDMTVDADSEIITAVTVLPANGDEAADATTLIEHEERTQGNDVQGLSIDGAGYRGALLREWTDPDGLNLDVTVPPTPVASAYFPLEQFHLDAPGTTLTCPAGQTTTNRYRDAGDAGWTFRFKRSTCAGCPLLTSCLKELPKTRGRTVHKSDYEAEYRAARAKVGTPGYEATRRQHWRVERKLAEVVRRHGGRRARYRGRGKVLGQALLTVMVVNVKRMVRLLTGGRVRAAWAASP